MEDIKSGSYPPAIPIGAAMAVCLLEGPKPGGFSYSSLCFFSNSSLPLSFQA